MHFSLNLQLEVANFEHFFCCEGQFLEQFLRKFDAFFGNTCTKIAQKLQFPLNHHISARLQNKGNFGAFSTQKCFKKARKRSKRTVSIAK